MVVGVLLAIDLAIMTTWQISDPFYRETKQLEPYVSFFFQIKTTYIHIFKNIFSKFPATSNKRRHFDN